MNMVKIKAVNVVVSRDTDLSDTQQVAGSKVPQEGQEAETQNTHSVNIDNGIHFTSKVFGLIRMLQLSTITK